MCSWGASVVGAACMAGGHAWWGAFVAGLHAWQGACMAETGGQVCPWQIL